MTRYLPLLIENDSAMKVGFEIFNFDSDIFSGLIIHTDDHILKYQCYSAGRNAFSRAI